jgi:hypothetical protein
MVLPLGHDRKGPTMLSPTFIAIAFLAAVLIVNWRLVLLVLSACLLAMILMGLGVGDVAAAPNGTPQTPATAPAEPGPAPIDEATPGQR